MNDGILLADALTEIGRRLFEASQEKGMREYELRRVEDLNKELQVARKRLQESEQNHLTLSHKFHENNKTHEIKVGEYQKQIEKLIKKGKK